MQRENRSGRDDEILLNRWTADALQAGPGDTVTLRYFHIEPAGGLTETGRLFRVRSVAAMEDLHRERDLVPDFPGLSDVEACRAMRFMSVPSALSDL